MYTDLNVCYNTYMKNDTILVERFCYLYDIMFSQKKNICTLKSHQIVKSELWWGLASYLHRQIEGFCEQKKMGNRHTVQ